MKLNLGCGRSDLPGFQNWDLANGHPAFPLEAPDGSVEEIYASHLLEHFAHHQTLFVLRDWFRALQPGGRVRIAVPDFEKLLVAWENVEPLTEQYLVGGQADENDTHRALFTGAKLRKLMEQAGFENIRPWVSEIRDCAALPISLNLEGVKPVPVALPVSPLKVVALWSCPRLGFMDTFMSIFEALPTLGIPLVRGMGAFWGQALERIAEIAIEQYHPDALLCLDYDAVFRPEDVSDLIALFSRSPGVAALAAHQWHRAKNVPLWTVTGRAPESFRPAELDRELFDVDTAHFGLTLLRTSALQSVPHPWFLGVPNAEGRWGDGRVDDDIYFWRKFKSAGQRVCVAPRVVAGHVELACRWPDENLRVVTQHLYDYHSNGRPSNVFGAGPTK